MNQEKNSFLYKIWDVLQPFLLYYLLHWAAFFLLTSLFQTSPELFGEAYTEWMTAHAETVTGVVSSVSMLLAVVPLLPMLKQEPEYPKRRMHAGEFVFTALLAVTSSLGLNVLLSIIGLTGASDTFRDVSQRQFGVAFGIGVVIYGFVSPLAEEIVFRGLLYRRMRKYCPVRPAVILSGVFFGVYHGNPVQGVYGSCMGILMAYLYERTGRFLIPVLFHALANLSVYSIAYLPKVQAKLFGAGSCAVLLTISVLCVICMEKVIVFEKK